MIVRTWHGRTRLSDGDDASHFLLITVWDSIEAVKKFAGDEPNVAKYYPEDNEFLLEKEAHSLNHQVFFSQ